jgi:hypothetical protein
MLNWYRRSAKEVYEHRPEQLTILVNGLFMASQKVSAGHGEQIVRIEIAEEIGFIEVLSEQGVRLLMLGVEAPPRGEAFQSKLVRLSDERTVQATLSHREQQPTLRVIYIESQPPAASIWPPKSPASSKCSRASTSYSQGVTHDEPIHLVPAIAPQ